MDINKTITEIVGENTSFSYDIRFNEKNVRTTVLIIKTRHDEYHLEPLVVTGELTKEAITDHYAKIKNDRDDIDKFLGVKIAKKAEKLEPIVATEKSDEVQSFSDLDF